MTARILSDNTLEIGMDVLALRSEWGCPESFPRAGGPWEALDPPPVPGPPIGVTSTANFNSRRILVAYPDGTIFQRQWDAIVLPPCTDGTKSNHREFVWVGEWTPFTRATK